MQFMNRRIGVFIYLFLGLCNYSSLLAISSNFDSGLYFYSYEIPKEDRTSLLVPISKIGGINDNFSIKFDIKLCSEKDYFGFVFRMLNEKHENLDLVIPDFYVKELISLNVSDKVILQFYKNEIPKFKPNNNWNSIELTFRNDSIYFIVNGLKKSAISPYKNMDDFDLYLGTNNDDLFFTYDIPEMEIKNVRILNSKGTEVRKWNLDKHAANVVYDEYKSEKAFASNPKWIIDDRSHWTKKATFLFDVFPQIAFDEKNEKIYFVRKNKMKLYDVKTNQFDSLKVQGEPYDCSYSNQIIYDTNNEKLISYNFTNDSLFFFNLANNKWNNNSEIIVEPFYGNHSRYFLSDDSTIVTFGGYGHHIYRSDLMKYSLKERKWESINLSKIIYPRYLGTMGYMGDGKLLYFGGYGNKSGNQKIHTHNFYDLYLIDIKTDSIRRLWEIEQGQQHYTCSNTMVIDKENNKFYTLAYDNRFFNTKLNLMQFDINTAENKSVGDTLPYTFIDNRSFCDLYFCSSTNQLVAVTANTREEDGYSQIDIYTINYRPLSEADVLQVPKELSTMAKILIVISLLIAVLAAGFFIYFRKKQINNKEKDNGLSENTRAEIPLRDIEEIPMEEIKPSSIYLLGGFRVIDSNKKDITKKFSPIIKSLFLIILLNTLKSGKGIRSLALKDILWFDKDDSSARNNRNVNLNKLRTLLLSVGKIDIVEDENYWCIVIDKNVFCDYQSILALCSKIKSEPEVNRTYILELIRLSSHGLLLPNVHAEWVDPFKADFTSMLIDTLLEISNKADVRRDYELLYKIGEVILLHDNIDEDGIRLKCFGLYHLNKKGKALQNYNKFCDEYKKLLDEDYKLKFNDLVK